MMVGMAVNSRYSRCSVEAGDWLYPPLFLNSLSLSLGFGISIRIAGQWAPGIGLHPRCRSYTALTQLSSGHKTHSKFHKLDLVILSRGHLFSLEVQGIRTGPLGTHSPPVSQAHPTVDAVTKASASLLPIHSGVKFFITFRKLNDLYVCLVHRLLQEYSM